MTKDWLAASSFERTHEIISAINTLSVHAKFIDGGIEGGESIENVQKARSRLRWFLERLQALLKQEGSTPSGPVVGSDPRLAEFASRFYSERQRLPRRSVLYSLPMDQLKVLISSEKRDDVPDLIACLHDLRSLVEQHSYADVIGLLGDM